MTNSLQRIIGIREETLTKLRALNGTAWKEVQGEVHGAHKEIPTWILLYDDGDIRDAHEAFSRVVAPYFGKVGDFNFTVSYTRFDGSDETTLDYLDNNREIARGYSVGDLGSNPSTRARASIFDAADSRRDGRAVS